jgi:hypothetical protein
MYQNGEQYIKVLQNVPNGHKINHLAAKDKMGIKKYRHLAWQGLSKFTQIGTFGLKKYTIWQHWLQHEEEVKKTWTRVDFEKMHFASFGSSKRNV